MSNSIDDLVGINKTSSDLSSQQIKVRYNESTSVSGSNGRKIAMRFPKIPIQFLSMSSLKLHATLSTTTDSYFDAPYASMIQRIRVLSSSTVLMDISDYGSLQSFLQQGETNVNSVNAQGRKNQGIFATVAEAVSAAAAPQRIALDFPKGSFLNTSALIPVDRLNGFLQVELFLQDPLKILVSPTNDSTSNYTLSDLQIHCDYISSPSLSSYFDANGVSFHTNNFSHRFQEVNSVKNVLRIPSGFTSLSKLLILTRDQSKVDSTNTLSTANRQMSTIAHTDIQELQFYSQNQPFFSENIQAENVTTELYNQTLQAFPAIGHSSFQNDVTASQTPSSVPLGISLQAAPQRFHDSLQSGLRSKNHVSDLYAHVTWKSSGVSYSNYSATVFLVNDSKIFLDSTTGALSIEY